LLQQNNALVQDPPLEMQTAVAAGLGKGATGFGAGANGLGKGATGFTGFGAGGCGLVTGPVCVVAGPAGLEAGSRGLGTGAVVGLEADAMDLGAGAIVDGFAAVVTTVNVVLSRFLNDPPLFNTLPPKAILIELIRVVCAMTMFIVSIH
jgi:hypothetical protein